MTLKYIISISGGGLANCLGSLFAGSFLAKRYDINYRFIWNNTIVNDISYRKLFKNVKAEHMQLSELNKFVDENINNITIITGQVFPEYWKDKNIPIYTCENFRHDSVTLSFIDNLDTEILIIGSCTVPKWAKNSNAIESFFEFFPPKYEFFNDPMSKIAIHVRGTDMFEIFGLTYRDVLPYVLKIRENHPNASILIYTDDKDVKNNLSENGFLISSANFVEKWDEKRDFNKQEWYETKTILIKNEKEYDISGQTNVFRSEKQVLGAFKDLFALAQSQVLYGFVTSRQSTFFELSSFLNNHKDILKEYKKQNL